MKSHFLQLELRKTLEETDGYEAGFNPRDLSGRRLKLWRKGDSVFDVTLRKFSRVVTAVFDPATYTRSNFEAVQDLAKQNRKYFFMVTLMVFSPLTLFLPFAINRALTARNRYLMHQLMKKRFIETSLRLESKKMKLSDLKKVLQEDPLNHS